MKCQPENLGGTRLDDPDLHVAPSSATLTVLPGTAGDRVAVGAEVVQRVLVKLIAPQSAVLATHAALLSLLVPVDKLAPRPSSCPRAWPWSWQLPAGTTAGQAGLGRPGGREDGGTEGQTAPGGTLLVATSRRLVSPAREMMENMLFLGR